MSDWIYSVSSTNTWKFTVSSSNTWKYTVTAVDEGYLLTRDGKFILTTKDGRKLIRK